MKILIGGGMNSKSLAIVFDPNLEDALEIKDPELRRSLKSRDACRKLRPILRKPDRSRLVRENALAIIRRTREASETSVN